MCLASQTKLLHNLRSWESLHPVKYNCLIFNYFKGIYRQYEVTGIEKIDLIQLIVEMWSVFLKTSLVISLTAQRQTCIMFWSIHGNQPQTQSSNKKWRLTSCLLLLSTSYFHRNVAGPPGAERCQCDFSVDRKIPIPVNSSKMFF